MSIFTLDWFKSKITKKLDVLKLEEKELKNELLKQQLSSKKMYQKMKLVNDVLTVVLHNGDVMSKSQCTIEDFQKIQQAQSEAMIIGLMRNASTEEIEKEVREVQETQAILKSIHVMDRMKDFVVSEDSVRIVGINRTMPELLVKKFIMIGEKYAHLSDDELQKTLENDVEYVSLKRFFMWCCLNPRAEVADELYRFLMENSFRITKQGFFVALRNVVSLQAENGDNTKIQFISNAYNKVKAVWKKKPEDFDVYEHLEDLKLIDTKRGIIPTDDNPYWKNLGNLKDLYLDLPNMQENRFTDDWTKTFDIRIGKVVNMPIEECNWSTQDCAAAGLHFTADQIHYVGCGDTSVLMLINPMKVVGIGTHKGRCYEYLPIMTVPRDEATKILHDLDFDTIDLDEFYVEHELNDLTTKAQEAFSEEAKKYNFNIPSVSRKQIDNIVEKLSAMKDELGKRVQEVV